MKKVLKCDFLNRGTYLKIIQSQRILKTKDSQVFCKPINNVDEFEGCFWAGSNEGWFKWFQSFQRLHSWTLNFIGPLAKKLKNVLFSKNIVIW